MANITKEIKKTAIKKTRKYVKGWKNRRKIISEIKVLDCTKSENDLANIFFENDCTTVPLRLFQIKDCFKYFKRWLEKDYNEAYKSVKYSNVFIENLSSIRDNELTDCENMTYQAMLKVISDGQLQLINQMNFHHNQLILEYQNECSKVIDEVKMEIAQLEVKRAKLKLKLFY